MLLKAVKTEYFASSQSIVLELERQQLSALCHYPTRYAESVISRLGYENLIKSKAGELSAERSCFPTPGLIVDHISIKLQRLPCQTQRPVAD